MLSCLPSCSIASLQFILCRCIGDCFFDAAQQLAAANALIIGVRHTILASTRPPSPRPHLVIALLLRAARLQVCAAPDQLLEAVMQLDTSALKPFPAKDACGIVDQIDDFMGRHRASR